MKIELEFNTKINDESEILARISHVVKVAKDKGFNLEELELVPEESSHEESQDSHLVRDNQNILSDSDEKNKLAQKFGTNFKKDIKSDTIQSF